MSDDYPTEEELERIKNWPYTDIPGLLEFTKSLWHFAEWGWSPPLNGVLRISTGGWSGNEDIISALRDNTMFWTLCWQSSRRGGHYEFSLPEEKP